MINKLLKILFVLILIAIIVLIIIYSIKMSKGNETSNVFYTFSGIVDEVNTTSIIVIPNEGEDIRKSSDKIQVYTADLVFYKGDEVTVKYEGEILETYPAKVEAISVIKKEYSKTVKLYLTAIDSIMNEDTGLNEGIEYLSIDTSTFITYPETSMEISSYPKINDDDEAKILNYCTKYNKDVRQNSFEELKAQGLYNEETLSLSGMLIYINNIKRFDENKVEFTITKYVSGLGALFGEYTLEYNGDIWEITHSEYAIS